MALVRVPLGKGKEAVRAPEGEYDVIAKRVFKRKDGRGWDVTVVIDGEPGWDVIRHTLWLPAEDADEEKVVNTMRAFRRFLTAFGIEYDEELGFDPDDIVGARARLAVRDGSYENKHGEVVTYSELVLPRVAD